MTFETWAAFAAATAVLLVIPGPTILLVVSYALGQGWRTALPTAAGVALGDFTAMTLSMLGVGALLATSATVFTVLKWAGAAYLVWLGIKLFRAGGTLDASPREDAVSSLKMLGHAWLVTALNPKSLTFFVAFLPQFLDPKADFWTQMLIFEATFVTLAAANAFGYALIASRARAVVSSPRAIRAINRTGGTLLIGAGIARWRCAAARAEGETDHDGPRHRHAGFLCRRGAGLCGSLPRSRACPHRRLRRGAAARRPRAGTGCGGGHDSVALLGTASTSSPPTARPNWPSRRASVSSGRSGAALRGHRRDRSL